MEQLGVFDLIVSHSMVDSREMNIGIDTLNHWYLGS